MFIFLRVIRQSFEYNLKIFANFRMKTQKSMNFASTFSKKLQFSFGYFNKDFTFYTKNLIFATKDDQSIVKFRILVTFLHL